MARRERVEWHENALFRAMRPEVLRDINLRLEPMQLAAGEVIFDESSDADCCFLVESGLVRISRKAPGSGHETLGFIGPGEFFGELALFYSAPRSARATAASETRVARLCRPDFERLRETAPVEVTEAIANAGVQHLREMHTRFIQHVGDSDRFRDIGIGLAMIAHDIRSPLATIKSAAELLSELLQDARQDTARLLQFTEMIQRTAVRAVEGADKLLADIRGELPRSETLIAANTLVDEVAEQVRGSTRGKPIEFHTVVEYDGALIGERSELVRALVNLTRNAVEALRPEGGCVELRVKEELGAIVFAVSDNGTGMAPETLGRIFERRFTQGKAGGTGLGLTQVRNVVERHNGRIDVQSKVGEGTTFRVWIPSAHKPATEDREVERLPVAEPVMGMRTSADSVSPSAPA